MITMIRPKARLASASTAPRLKAHYNDANGKTVVSNVEVDSVEHALLFGLTWNLDHQVALATVMVWQTGPVMAIAAHCAVA
jgi:hypothetical protein